MNDEFQWWLLLVGLVIGALLVFLVMVDFSRSADEQAEAEVVRESTWIAKVLQPTDGELDPNQIGEILRLHREWLAGGATSIDAGSGIETPPRDEPPPGTSDPWPAHLRSTSDMESDGA
ncbi:MAG TPA: hypothetical protein VKR24_06065 [Candidatus Limnocylindrales bacterium]|nr:hypothetical protein [Candidatus Limnocylindrales bacterium]